MHPCHNQFSLTRTIDLAILHLLFRWCRLKLVFLTMKLLNPLELRICTDGGWIWRRSEWSNLLFEEHCPTACKFYVQTSLARDQQLNCRIDGPDEWCRLKINNYLLLRQGQICSLKQTKCFLMPSTKNFKWSLKTKNFMVSPNPKLWYKNNYDPIFQAHLMFYLLMLIQSKNSWLCSCYIYTERN